MARIHSDVQWSWSNTALNIHVQSAGSTHCPRITNVTDELQPFEFIDSCIVLRLPVSPTPVLSWGSELTCL